MKNWSKQRKLIGAVISVAVLLFVAFLLVDRLLPHSFEHDRHIFAWEMSGAIRNWEQRENADLDFEGYLGYSKHHVSEMIATNVTVNGSSYRVRVRVTELRFKDKGYYLGAEHGTVLWVGADGEISILIDPSTGKK